MPDSFRKDIAIIIVSWNTCELLRECLLSLHQGVGAFSCEIWVVDNASDDGSLEMLAEEFPGVRVIANDENVGFTRANNQALSQISADYVLLLNSDARLGRQTGEKLARFLKEHPRAAMVGPRLLSPEGTLQPSTYPLPGIWREAFRLLYLYKLVPRRWARKILLGSFWDHNEALPVGRLTGACVLVRKTVIDEVGLLSEEFPIYGEVHDWCWRMWKAGWEIWFSPEAEVVHIGGVSADLRWTRQQQREQVLQATWRLYRKHLSSSAVKVILWLHLLSSSLACLRGKFKTKEERLGLLPVLSWERNWYWGALRQTMAEGSGE